jgi:hypothetical protein
VFVKRHLQPEVGEIQTLALVALWAVEQDIARRATDSGLSLRGEPFIARTEMRRDWWSWR